MYPVSIPHHGNKDIPRGTVNNILNAFEEEIAAWEVKLLANRHGPNGSENKK